MNVPSPSRPANIPPAILNPPEHEEAVLQAIRDTTFGTIEVTVHQSRIVQIVRSEKQRFDQR
jgi:hypothetical protein